MMHFFSDLFVTHIAYADLDSFLANVDTMIVNPIIELMFAVAVVMFLYGMLEFILNQQNEEKRTVGKSHMMWGVIGITIMIGVWGILGFMVRTLGISNQVQINDQGNNTGSVKVDLGK